jgi:hypothetical protein
VQASCSRSGAPPGAGQLQQIDRIIYSVDVLQNNAPLVLPCGIVCNTLHSLAAHGVRRHQGEQK